MTTKLTDVEITLTDLADVRQVLAACSTFLGARDMMDAQLRLTAYRPSALASEVERMKVRFDSYMADLLLAERDAEEEAEEAEDAEEEVEEELTDDPLGKVVLPQQEGRRVSLEELQERQSAAEENDPADGFA